MEFIMWVIGMLVSPLTSEREAKHRAIGRHRLTLAA
jgi:hypothetical protein